MAETFRIKDGNLLISGGTLIAEADGGPDRPPEPPEPPDPPPGGGGGGGGDEGCAIINPHTHSKVHPVVSGPWRGWCSNEPDPSRGRGDESMGRQFADRVSLYRYLEYGNHIRTTCDILVPTSWFYWRTRPTRMATAGRTPTPWLWR